MKLDEVTQVPLPYYNRSTSSKAGRIRAPNPNTSTCLFLSHWIMYQPKGDFHLWCSFSTSLIDKKGYGTFPA